MQAGKLRQLVTVQVPTESVAADGQRTFAYSTDSTEWAMVRNISQSKGTDGEMQAGGVERYEVRMRHRSGIEYDTRLQYDGKTLQIVGRENVNERNREWRLECEVVEQ